jgi:acetyl esterase/lipase
MRALRILGTGACLLLLTGLLASCSLFDGEDYETITYGNEPSQFGELSMPDGEGPFPAVVLLHGGSWSTEVSVEATRDLAAWLADHGWAAWNLEYARVGENLGGYPGTLEDVAAGVDHLQVLAEQEDRPIDLDRVIVMGHSAGGQLALWAASRTAFSGDVPGADPVVTPAAAVSLAGVTDMQAATNIDVLAGPVEAFLGGTPDEQPERYTSTSPIDLVPLGMPQLIAHGQQDDTVPMFMGTDYTSAARAAGDQVELLELDDTNHFSFLDPETPAWQEVSRRLEGLLPAPAPTAP